MLAPRCDVLLLSHPWLYSSPGAPYSLCFLAFIVSCAFILSHALTYPYYNQQHHLVPIEKRDAFLPPPTPRLPHLPSRCSTGLRPLTTSAIPTSSRHSTRPHRSMKDLRCPPLASASRARRPRRRSLAA
ncbi:hypothetical protein HDK77DRAFT_57566 [Phyllosticta capitalensis]